MEKVVVSYLPRCSITPRPIHFCNDHRLHQRFDSQCAIPPWFLLLDRLRCELGDSGSPYIALRDLTGHAERIILQS